LIAKAAGAVEIAVEASGAGVAVRSASCPAFAASRRHQCGRRARRRHAHCGWLARTCDRRSSRWPRPGLDLYELHRHAGNLENLFQQLTQAPGE